MKGENKWNELENTAKTKSYPPNPINSDDVILHKEIEELVESLAEQVHEN